MVVIVGRFEKMIVVWLVDIRKSEKSIKTEWGARSGTKITEKQVSFSWPGGVVVADVRCTRVKGRTREPPVRQLGDALVERDSVGRRRVGLRCVLDELGALARVAPERRDEAKVRPIAEARQHDEPRRPR